MSKNEPCVYIIAGELSGDTIGAKIMSELSKIAPSSKFIGVGGPKMQSMGLASFFNYQRINLMGFAEVLPHILSLRALIKQTADDVTSKQPNILITIDSPGFNYRVARLVRNSMPELKIVHIVAPSVWAYKPERAAKFAAVYSHMLTLLPFEPQYFETEGLPATCIGHPIFEQKFGGGDEFRKSHNISKNTKIILVTPGSRKGEVMRHLPIFLRTLEIVRKKHPDVCVIIAKAGYESYDVPKGYLVVGTDERLAAYAAADVALAKSGTNTLEIAASSTPMIVAYKLNFFTFWAIKLMAKIKYASLINIVAKREVIPEFLQHKATSSNLANGLLQLLENPVEAKKQVKESGKSLKAMGFGSKSIPAKIAAKVIAKCL